MTAPLNPSAPPAHAKPRPRMSPDSKPFWDGCRRHELLLPTCEDCGRAHLPPGPVCPFCFSDRLAWKKASGRGRISTFVVVHKEWFPAFKPDLPYNVVQVELEEGPRLTANLVGHGGRKPVIGEAVRVVFDTVDDSLTMPRFEPA
ncbi:Zn-ribbon domain-containing OB-fold protein [Prosthecodimorpha staleyi]|uniref:OB-fold domain-containing protein n=1 Tax=Prosthecodimorpha staleyi TaxID=2840188 RepID=A0A947D3C1_9HYPH|nr:OB-fold domain-containing protein [Prosthecodimorpha staleyi]MBT9290005.1 OB-fold domain-containing protein [Prosthecodimorpha staleyi]